MASFFKKFFKGSNGENDDFKDSLINKDLNKIEAWSKSPKNFNDLELLFQIEDEIFVFSEYNKLKEKNNLICNDFQIAQLLAFISKRNNIKHHKLSQILNNIRLLNKFFQTLNKKAEEINRKISIQNQQAIEQKSDIIKTTDIQNENMERNKQNPYKKRTQTIENISDLKLFDFLHNKFFFIENKILDIIESEEEHIFQIVVQYLEFALFKLLNIDYFEKNFGEHLNKIDIKNLCNQLSFLIYGSIFDIFINNDENYFNKIIFYIKKLNRLIDSKDNNNDNVYEIKLMKKILYYLIPNELNCKILQNMNFYNSNEYNLNLIFCKYISNNLSIKEFEKYEFEVDLTNELFNFLIVLEKKIRFVREKDKVSDPLFVNKNDNQSYSVINKGQEEQVEDIPFFEVYRIIKEIFVSQFKNPEINTSNEKDFICDYTLKNFVFLDFILHLYDLISNLNKNYSVKNKINDKLDIEFENKKITIQKDLFFENFISNDIDFFLSEDLLKMEIFMSHSKENQIVNIEVENNSLNQNLINFLKNLFDLIFLSNKFVDFFQNINCEKNYVVSTLEENYIYINQISQLPSILFLKFLKINSPLKLFQYFLNEIKHSLMSPISAEKLLYFSCFQFINHSLETLACKKENYSTILKRFELINEYFNIEKLKINLNLKINFLEVINKNSQDKIIYFTLKELIGAEADFQQIIHKLLIIKKETDVESENKLNSLFDEDINIIENKILSHIYEFVTNLANKFNNLKALKFFTHNQKDFLHIIAYLNFLNEKILNSLLTSNLRRLNIVDFVILVIKKEKMNKFCIAILEQNTELLNYMNFNSLEIFIDLFAEVKTKLKEKENEQAIESIVKFINSISKAEEEEELTVNDTNKKNERNSNIITNEKTEINTNYSNIFDTIYAKEKISTKNSKGLQFRIQELKFKLKQLLKFLKLKKIFIKNALDINLADFDYENFKINTIIEIYIIKKFNIDLLTDIKDFYSKTTDIREALGLSSEEYLNELSSIFYKYKLNNMYAGILNAFYEINYLRFERCLLNMKKDKEFDMINFIFEKKFELKILENSTNIYIINQINDHLSNKNRIEQKALQERVNKSCSSYDNKAKKENLKICNEELDKSDLLSSVTFLNFEKKSSSSDLSNSIKLTPIKFSFKKGFNIEKAYLQVYEKEKPIADNLNKFLEILYLNFDFEKCNFNSIHNIKGDYSDSVNNSYSLHPKLIEILDHLNYNFRGKEFKLNTNIAMKSRLYKNILKKNFCAVENILQWENYSYDLKNVKNLTFLERFTTMNQEESSLDDDSYLIITKEEEKIFYLFNLISFIYCPKQREKYELILENLSNIFFEKFCDIVKKYCYEKLYLKNIENDKRYTIDDIADRVKNNLLKFLMDSVYETIKNTKTFNFSNLLFWRFFFEKLESKLFLNQDQYPELKVIENKISDIKMEFLYNVTAKFIDKNSIKSNNNKQYNELVNKIDFIFESIQRINPEFNILLLFGENFFEKFDYRKKIKNRILSSQLEEYSKKFYYFKNATKYYHGNSFKAKTSNSLKMSLETHNLFSDFELFFVLEVFKNLDLKNIFFFIKILDFNILQNIFSWDKNSNLAKPDKFNLKMYLAIKLVNTASNISSFIAIDRILLFNILNFLKNSINSEEEFKEIINEILYVPDFNNLMEASRNIILLDKNLNAIVKDYFETKIKIFTEILQLFKEKFKLSPIAETNFKLIKIKSFICNLFISNLRNIYSDISDLDDYQELENYIKEERFKKEIYKIYTSTI